MADIQKRSKDPNEQVRQTPRIQQPKVKRKNSQTSPVFQPTTAPVHLKLGTGKRKLSSPLSAPATPSHRSSSGSSQARRMRPGALSAQKKRLAAANKLAAHRSPRVPFEGGGPSMAHHHPTSPGWSPSFDLLAPGALSSSDSESEDEFLLDMKVDELAPPDDPLGLRRRHVRSASMPLLFDRVSGIGGRGGHGGGGGGSNTVRGAPPGLVRRSPSARGLPLSARFQKENEKLSHSDWIRSSTNQGSPGLFRRRKQRASKANNTSNTLPTPASGGGGAGGAGGSSATTTTPTTTCGVMPALMTVHNRPKRFPLVPASPKSPKVGNIVPLGDQGNVHSAVQGSGGHTGGGYPQPRSPRTPPGASSAATGGHKNASSATGTGPGPGTGRIPPPRSGYPRGHVRAAAAGGQSAARMRAAQLPRCVTAPPGTIQAQHQRKGRSSSPQSQVRTTRSSLPSHVAARAAARHVSASSQAPAAGGGASSGGRRAQRRDKRAVKKPRAASDAGVTMDLASAALSKMDINRSSSVSSTSSSSSDTESSVSSVSSSASSSDVDL